MVSSLSRSLQQLCPTVKFTLRLMENVLCKAYRQFSAENRGRVQFNDTLLPEQLLYQQVGTNVQFLAMDGSRGDLGTAIFERFPFGDEMRTMEEIVQACNVHKRTLSRRRGSFPRQLMQPRARFQLDIPLQVLPRCRYSFIRRHLHAAKGAVTSTK